MKLSQYKLDVLTKKWFLESEKIIFVSKDIKEEYKVTYYSGESLKLEEVNSKKEYHFTKMFNF